MCTIMSKFVVLCYIQLFYLYLCFSKHAIPRKNAPLASYGTLQTLLYPCLVVRVETSESRTIGLVTHGSRGPPMKEHQISPHEYEWNDWKLSTVQASDEVVALFGLDNLLEFEVEPRVRHNEMVTMRLIKHRNAYSLAISVISDSTTSWW